jgi:hypothetical protein
VNIVDKTKGTGSFIEHRMTAQKWKKWKGSSKVNLRATVGFLLAGCERE